MPTLVRLSVPRRLVAPLERERRIRAKAGLLLQPPCGLDVRPHGAQRGFALERARDRRIELQTRALVDILRCQRRWCAQPWPRAGAASTTAPIMNVMIRRGSHCTLPSKLAEPRPAGPFHSMLIGHAPAMPNSAVAVNRPGTPDGCTCTFPGMTMPGIVMFARRAPCPHRPGRRTAERNSIVKVLRPVLSVPVGESSTISMSPDRTVWTTRPPACGDPASVAGGRLSRQPHNERAHDGDQEHRRDQHPASSERTCDRNGERLVLQSQLPLTDREEDDRRHDQHVDERRDHAAEHGRGQRFHHFRARHWCST